MKLIPLCKGKNKGTYFAQVDDEDYEFLMQWNWGIHKRHNTLYACTSIYLGQINGKTKTKFVQMHRLILQVFDPSVFVDHADHNGLNNQKTNIRIATPSQNRCNIRTSKNRTSQYLGVALFVSKRKYTVKSGETRVSITKKWVAQIMSNKKNIYLGSFDDEVEAAKVYDAAAIKYHGIFANPNFPIESSSLNLSN